MELLVDAVQPKKPTLELGDVLVHESCGAYIIINQGRGMENAFVAKGINGTGGLFGIYDSLKDLNDAFYGRSTHLVTRVFKASEYDLQLVKK